MRLTLYKYDTDGPTYLPAYGRGLQFVGDVKVSRQNENKATAEALTKLGTISSKLTITATTVTASDVSWLQSNATAYATIQGADGITYRGAVDLEKTTLKADKYSGHTLVEISAESLGMIAFTNRYTARRAIVDASTAMAYTDAGSVLHLTYEESDPHNVAKFGLSAHPVTEWPSTLTRSAALSWLNRGAVPSGWTAVGVVEL